MFKKSIDALLCIATLFLALTLPPTAAMGYEKEIAALSANLKEQIQTSGKKKVAVVDFTDLQGNITELGRFVAEELSTSLFNAKGSFEVVDRSSLQTLLKEHKLSATGLIDPKDTQKIVKISGVDGLITGNITSSSDSMRLSVKILDSETAKMIGADKGNLPATDFLKELDKKGVVSAGVSFNAPEGQSSSSGGGKPATFNIESKVEAQGFTFALQGCKRKGKDVKCEFLITSTDGDKNITIMADQASNSSSFLDGSGEPFYAKKVALGNSHDNGSITARLYKDSPVKMILEFGEASPTSEVMNILSVKCSANNVGNFEVKFQNVPIKKTT